MAKKGQLLIILFSALLIASIGSTPLVRAVPPGPDMFRGPYESINGVYQLATTTFAGHYYLFAATAWDDDAWNQPPWTPEYPYYVRYQFNWGDGSSTLSDWVIAPPAQYLFDYGYEAGMASHSWDYGGTYSVTVMAIDEEGETTLFPDVITMHIIGPSPPAPPPPHFPPPEWPPYQPSLFGPMESGSYDIAASTVTQVDYWFGSSATDPNWEEFQYEFDWGDGTITTTDWCWQSSPFISHQWNTPGTYQVRSRALDITNQWSEYSEPITVNILENPNPPPPPPPPPPLPRSLTVTAYQYSTLQHVETNVYVDSQGVGITDYVTDALTGTPLIEVDSIGYCITGQYVYLWYVEVDGVFYGYGNGIQIALPDAPTTITFVYW